MKNKEAKTIIRPDYLEPIKGFIDDGEFVKIITGLRRSGKSELMKMIKSEVVSRGVGEEHIIFLDFEELWLLDMRTPVKLAEFILSKMTDNKKYYLFFDEIQIVENWEQVIVGLRKKNTDIYVTGSNSKLLAGEWSTLLGGRCLIFTMHTLSYGEFVDFRKKQNIEPQSYILYDKETKEIIYDKKSDMILASQGSYLDDYFDFGGFPALSIYPYSLVKSQKIVRDIYSTALYKDVVQRYNIRNNDLLNRIVAYLFDNVGNLTSLKNIQASLLGSGRKVDPETIANYVGYLEEAFIIKKAAPYDIKGRGLLDSVGKYYLGDHSLQYSVRGIRVDKKQGVLENIVFKDLQRRGYEVYVGRIGEKEVDFVAEKKHENEKVYVQVCLEFSSKEVFEREFSSLKLISDNYPKYVVNMDRHSSNFTDEGIVAISLDKFLLKESL
ncbi:MAG: ATP-binding protein [Firmicutes bacterium]|nr:ATP-binding protein [Bacillota bacterium]